MQKRLKVFDLLQKILGVVFIILFYHMGGNFGEELFEVYPDISGFQFAIKYGILICLILVIYFISVVLHEIGHLIFGLNAGMKFEELNVLGVSLVNKDGKLKFKKGLHLKNIGGYCNLTLDENKQYSNKKLVLYLLGGIIVNFTLSIVFGITLCFMNDLWAKYFALLMMFTNLYFGLHNAIPSISATGIEVDMLKAIYTYKDKDYLQKINTVGKISDKQKDGVRLSELQISLPDTFKSSADVVLGILYVDKLIEEEKYEEARKAAEKIETDGHAHLSEQNKVLINLQMMECELNDECNTDIIKALWTKPVKKQTKLLSRLHPSYLYFMYAGTVLAENDFNTAQKYLEEFNKMSDSLSKEELKNYKVQFAFIDSKRTS